MLKFNLKSSSHIETIEICEFGKNIFFTVESPHTQSQATNLSYLLTVNVFHKYAVNSNKNQSFMLMGIDIRLDMTHMSIMKNW